MDSFSVAERLGSDRIAVRTKRLVRAAFTDSPLTNSWIIQRIGIQAQFGHVDWSQFAIVEPTRDATCITIGSIMRMTNVRVH